MSFSMATLYSSLRMKFETNCSFEEICFVILSICHFSAACLVKYTLVKPLTDACNIKNVLFHQSVVTSPLKYVLCILNSSLFSSFWQNRMFT